MYAVEFETRIKDGLVRLPATLQNIHSSEKARVIIMLDEEPGHRKPSEAGFIEQLTCHPRHLGESVVFLSRDQANER